MIVFPLKYLPWLLLLGGIGFIISGEAPLFGILLLAVGGGWAFYQVKNRRK